MQKLALILVLTQLVGCGTLGRSTAEWPWKGPKEPLNSPCEKDTCSKTEARNAFVAANQFCRDAANYYEKSSNLSSSSQIAAGWVGAVAGAVISPIANGSAKTAWSGLSGATNTLQTQIGDIFSATLHIRKAAAIQEIAETSSKEIISHSDPDKQVLQSISMVRNCALAGNGIDSSALRVINNNQQNATTETIPPSNTATANAATK